MEQNVPLFSDNFYAGIEAMNEAAKYYIELNSIEIKEDRTRNLLSAMSSLLFLIDHLEAKTYPISNFTKNFPNSPLINERYNNKTMYEAAIIQEKMLDTIRSSRFLLVEAEYLVRNLSLEHDD